MIGCHEAVDDLLREFGAGFECRSDGERLEIITPYLHPDNDLVEVFVEEVRPHVVRVTDLGETLRRLETLGMDAYASTKRRFLVEQIASRTHVSIHRGMLEKEGPDTEVGSLLLDVLAASHATSDLIYSSKAYEPATFSKQVSTFLSERGIEHESAYRVVGTTGKHYRVSVKARGLATGTEVLIQAMSPSQQSMMVPMVNRALRMWFDIGADRRKVSLLDDEDFSWHRPDVALLERVSNVQMWTDKEELTHIIEAA